MKTKEQILEWLDKQPWKNEFYENHFKHNIGDRISCNENFIRSSFDWPIGGGVWIEREEEYLKWYNSNDRPMSWEEYCEQNPITEDEYVIDNNHGVFPLRMKSTRSAVSDITVMSKELCEAFIAYMKLIQLRNAWVKDCKRMPLRFKIMSQGGKVMVSDMILNSCGLSFEYMTTAEEFINVFKDLLETAKPLL